MLRKMVTSLSSLSLQDGEVLDDRGYSAPESFFSWASVRFTTLLSRPGTHQALGPCSGAQ